MGCIDLTRAEPCAERCRAERFHQVGDLRRAQNDVAIRLHAHFQYCAGRSPPNMSVNAPQKQYTYMPSLVFSTCTTTVLPTLLSGYQYT